VCKLRMRVEDHFARICAAREAVMWYATDCVCVGVCARVCARVCVRVRLGVLLSGFIANKRVHFPPSTTIRIASLGFYVQIILILVQKHGKNDSRSMLQTSFCT